MTTGGREGVGISSLSSSTPNISLTLDHKGWGTTYKYIYFRFANFPITLIFIQRLRLRRIFSFSAFSYDAYFQSAHSPNAPIFIPRLLLWNLFSLCVISYDAYLHSAHSPTALKEKRRRGKKITLWKIPKGPKMQISEKIRWNTVKWP
jgi:hypothetical protein